MVPGVPLEIPPTLSTSPEYETDDEAEADVPEEHLTLTEEDIESERQRSNFVSFNYTATSISELTGRLLGLVS